MFLFFLLQVRILVKHVPSDVFAETGSESAAADLFLVGGQDAFQMKQVGLHGLLWHWC